MRKIVPHAAQEALSSARTARAPSRPGAFSYGHSRVLVFGSAHACVSPSAGGNLQLLQHTEFSSS